MKFIRNQDRGLIVMVIRLRMSGREIKEARMASIPENIISKMVEGLELTEIEKGIVHGRGKVYVLGHYKGRDDIKIKPQLRNLPKSIEKIRIITNAPTDYDWFGTETVAHFSGTKWREVVINKEHLNAQVMRYRSGLHGAYTQAQWYDEKLGELLLRR